MKRIYLFLLFLILTINPFKSNSLSKEFKDKRLFVPVIGNNLNLRIKPNLKSKVIIQLKILESVQIMKIIKKEVIINNKRGRWVFVNTGRTPSEKDETYKGWVFDYYLGYKHKFKKVKNINKMDITCATGDWEESYIIHNNGSVDFSYVPCHDGNCGENKEYLKCEKGDILKNGSCYGKGHVYEYKNIFLIHGIYFIIKDNYFKAQDFIECNY
jgi:hypothetical protein